MKRYRNRSLLIMLLVTILAISLLVVVACDNTSNPSDNKTTPKLTATFDATHKVYNSDSLDSLKPYFTVTYTDENEQTTQVTDFILIGSLQVGDSKIAVNYQDLTVVVTVSVLKTTVQPDEPQNQPKIEAVFDATHKVYNTDSLDSLRPYLTVTYTDENGQSTQVTDYTLLGSLTVGDSIIAVNYQDLIAIVTINVLKSSVSPEEPKSKLNLTAVFDDTHTVYEKDGLDSLRPYLTVTYTDTNGQSTQVTDYTLLGSLTVGDSIIAVNYQGLFAYLTIKVSKPSSPPKPTQQPELKATFDFTHTVYEGDSLESLRPYLTVTYTSAYGETIHVYDYKFTGSLSVGDNLIGVIGFNLTAVITINVVPKPTVTFVADGQVVAVKTYTKYNLSVQEPTVPSKTGYTGAWEEYTLTENTGDITVNAVYTGETYTVTFDYNGADGNNTVQSMSVTYGQPIGTLPTPTRTDHDFVGWYYNGTQINSSNNWSRDYGCTLVAKWITHDYDSNGLKYLLSKDGSYYIVIGYNDSVSSVLTIPESYLNTPITAINQNAFENCVALTNVVLHDNITSIDDYAFSGCSQLESIDLGAGVEHIGKFAFTDCVQLTSITIPASVRTINFAPFANCPSLESITVESGNEYFNGEGDCLVRKSDGTLINGCKNSVIPTDGSVLIIDYYAFDGCRDLTEIDIPDSVTKIRYYAFRNCVSLKSILIPESVGTLYGYVFSGCSALESVTLSNNLSALAVCVFSDCVSLKSITIPGKVRVISGAFGGCSNLESITILSGEATSLTIGMRSFENCDKLSAIYYEGTEEEWNNLVDIRLNSGIENATVYFYSEDTPQLNEEGTDYDGNYWHWDAGVPTVWKKED